MNQEDLLGFIRHKIVDEKTQDYAKRIREVDNLVLIFPIWWELMPTMMKGFIDKVVFPGTFYEYTKSGYGMKTLVSNLKKVTVITTMNTPID